MNMLRKPISLEQLVALNHEITALCDAGIPLEQGLRQAASQMQGKKQAVANRLAKAMESGATLEQAIEDEGDRLPPIYQSFVRAGIQSGRLAKVLESLSEITSRVSSLRQSLFLASLYPFVLLCIALGILFVADQRLFPGYEWIGIDSYKWLAKLNDWRWGSWSILHILPCVFLLIGWWCWWQANPIRANSKLRLIPYDRIPFLGRVYRLSAYACFADLLRMLVKQRIPLDVALPLAADATGYADLQSTCNRAAADLQQGKTPTNLPPLIRLALSASHTSEQTNDTLFLIANAYRGQANSIVQNFSIYMPIVATGLVGGLIVLGYTLVMLYPYIESLKTLSFWYS